MKNLALFVLSFISIISYSQRAGQLSQNPITVDTKNLLVSIDASVCRWSAEVKGTEMKINEVFFLPGDDPSGWTVTSSVNYNDNNNLGSYVTVTLRGTKPGQLDFDYQLSVSKTGNDILVSLGRANNTGKDVDIDDMDYFVSRDVRLGSTSDRWITLGTQSRNRDLYELLSVINLITPKTYAVNHVVKDSDTGNSLLMGHITTQKGASRFEVRSGWTGKRPDHMQVRGYCSYKVTMPSGKTFPGEKLLIDFSKDAIRAMEHQADLIAIAHDVRLKERRPINPDDRELVSNNYSRFHGWMSGGNNTSTKTFFEENGLFDFCWGLGGPGRSGSMAIYGSGGSTSGRFPTFDINGDWGAYGAGTMTTGRRRVTLPDECFLPIRTVKFGGERVLQWAAGQEQLTGRAETDFSDWWDKWPGQYDPFMSALETYHAAMLAWREAVDKIVPRMVIRSNMQPVDHSYGLVDILRVSEDADHGCILPRRLICPQAGAAMEYAG
ncbi:MAG: hypothetical protein MUO72_19905 [Bacteroidales bacterium]|nr:hypothetical protein [Bacteroidales bacterium]